ncbi:hypothetical protein [Cohnella silvisoli]|uniref:N-acetyltransferase domain-containing protein n=1 Tax=Cohnella silvisoli TaxID=2873699 RepID=A0ABV1L166_9BACL|nr:hypothetical protein [Cohnella silvisoli]MCD9025285.1 hypothetical protein [Cohnella silvisoli]
MNQWLTADSEAAKESAVILLSRNGEHLGVPYQWSTVLSSLLCSMYDNGLMIGLDSSGEIAGVLAYTSGTGEDKYQDRTKIEVHLLFIEKRMRSGRMLTEAMRTLAGMILDSPSEIREIAFYANPSAINRRLFGKFAELIHTSEHPCGMLDYYRVIPERLLVYASRHSA